MCDDSIIHKEISFWKEIDTKTNYLFRKIPELNINELESKLKKLGYTVIIKETKFEFIENYGGGFGPSNYMSEMRFNTIYAFKGDAIVEANFLIKEKTFVKDNNFRGRETPTFNFKGSSEINLSEILKMF